MKRVIVSGGGWAGLAAAVELARRGIPVLLLESAGQLGGRARSVDILDTRLDNGQHLMIGAYRDMLSLLKTLGVREGDVFQRLPLELRMQSPAGSGYHLATPRLPAPLHLLWGLAGARGLTVAERRQALRMAAGLAAGASGNDDPPLEEFLRKSPQENVIIKKLWEPLCLAMLNTPIGVASSRVFRRVLRDTFARRRRDSDLLIPRTDLGALLPGPAHAFITSHGGEVRLKQRVTALQVEDGRVSGVVLAGGEALAAEHVILAVPDTVCQRLLAPHPPLASIADRLARFRHAPICTVYLRYPPHIRLGTPMAGLLDTTAQWVFDRRLTGNPGVMAVVISSHGPHMALGNDELIARIASELATLNPAWPAPDAAQVIREKRATLLCHAGIDALRPGNATPLGGCWVAGDYTDTGYPSVLEGAVRSGLDCARKIRESNDLIPWLY